MEIGTGYIKEMHKELSSIFRGEKSTMLVVQGIYESCEGKASRFILFFRQY